MFGSNSKPVVGITCCSTLNGIHHQQVVGDKYIRALIEGSDVIPVLIPGFGEQMAAILPHLDGLYLTGSYSNMEPHHFGGDDLGVEMPRDPNRDTTNLYLLKQAVELKMPVFGICRGFQEMNVALGGTLHQQLFTLDNMMEHRENKSLTIDEQYSLAHELTLNPQGVLAEIMAGELTQQVNSLHGQGVAKLAPPLKVEASAPDGLVEAFSLADNSSFYLGVQWHPEWKIQQQPFYAAIFKRFGEACRHFQEIKN
ncbi:gamma-glutamyl-gamma-aminobutyrate hydrolase [Colwellia chukchiensis]|uniref:gamma-glutamyl-gamma-aminobutyrate hydrolase n=1 Tax=Colwellia chukchiensis TaxID=641665 RepID=A0A1H7QB35_9GAMM|nr:gamma-glutamyl-gamma-aminobutyrate hydrolase family protein [Colwellia chukchiensis]SEL45039.1 gamma-glutamyl-gamma-aminobutyrate hydrolase [Colwellia chukchiensis]